MTGAELLTAYAAGRRDFREARLRDAQLRKAHLHGISLRCADLRFADLCGANLTNADLQCAHFMDADLSDADLSNSDLYGAVFRGAYLWGANLRGAFIGGADMSGAHLQGAIGLPDAPVVPNIDAAILAKIDAGGVLNMAQWHTCETTHCRAGWAICVAGEAGAALDRAYGTNVAAALIYAASRPNKRVPNWYATDDEALADLRACAAEAP